MQCKLFPILSTHFTMPIFTESKDILWFIFAENTANIRISCYTIITQNNKTFHYKTTNKYNCTDLNIARHSGQHCLVALKVDERRAVFPVWVALLPPAQPQAEGAVEELKSTEAGETTDSLVAVVGLADGGVLGGLVTGVVQPSTGRDVPRVLPICTQSKEKKLTHIHTHTQNNIKSYHYTRFFIKSKEIPHETAKANREQRFTILYMYAVR